MVWRVTRVWEEGGAAEDVRAREEGVEREGIWEEKEEGEEEGEIRGKG